MSELQKLRWAVLGTGVIANQMAQALQSMGRTLDAVGNRTYDKGVAFAEKYNALCLFRAENGWFKLQIAMQKP